MPADTIFDVRNLSFRYERRLAVSCERLTLVEGECVAFVGANGSGKTTMLKLLNRLIGPYSGKIDFMGHPLAGNPWLRKRSVYLHQHPVMFVGTVRANLEFALRLKGVKGPAAISAVEAAAKRFKIDHLLVRDAARLSGGETQRVAMLRAAVAGTDVLLLDEPTSSMDKESEAGVREMLVALKHAGATIIFSSHDEALVTLLADRRVSFQDGTATEEFGTTIQIKPSYPSEDFGPAGPPETGEASTTLTSTLKPSVQTKPSFASVASGENKP